jgi:NAD(P)-dependent dehydrogenase (short-subunit alcohol dehydrogenase family)
MKKGGSIINTTSINAYKGNAKLLDYTSTKGGIVAFTRGLALQLVEKGIRVNGVAPGPVWTPLIPASMSEEMVKNFGKSVPMQRAAQPNEIAPSYVFLASNTDSSYISGQVLHPNGTHISRCHESINSLVIVVFWWCSDNMQFAHEYYCTDGLLLQYLQVES